MYLDNNNNNNLYIIDTEANGLTPTKFWCSVILKKDTREVWKLYGDNLHQKIKQFIEERPDAVWIGHNIISYDGYYIEQLCDTVWNYTNTIDTLVLSYLYNPALIGGHSLAAYGERFKYSKLEHEDWTQFSQEMLERCEKDVYLTEKVYNALVQRMNKIGFSELSCEIEHKTARIISEQTRNGCWFDSTGANNLLRQLRERESNLSKSIHKLFSPKLEEVGRYKRRKRKDGSDYASYERHLQEFDAVEEHDDGTYSTYRYTEFNIGSPKQRLERLLGLGFEPTEKTKKGNPKVDEDTLVAFAKKSDIPEVQAMSEWLVCSARANMVENWLSYVKEDHRIHGRVFSCGAASRRMSHSQPNISNIPSPQNGAAYGEECRSLWGCTPDCGRVLVGYDAKGLETHILCHLLDNKEATELLLNGDVHQLNADTLTKELGFPVVRGGGGAKTLLYAAIFGAYPSKLGSILKKNSKVGEMVQEILFTNIPGYKKLLKEVAYEWKHNDGILQTIDGGYVRCPSEHSALNYKIQPNGAVLMKQTSIYLNERAREQKIWHLKVLDCHDEGQHETLKETGDILGSLAVSCITDAGKDLGFRVKMTGDYKIGNTWASTH